MKGVLNSLARPFRPKRAGIECLEISMPLTIRDHLASIYCMLILGIDLPTAFSAHEVHGFYFISFYFIFFF